ncbi:MAG: DNA cytosine methyltransferase [Nevskiaceae bacterium]|nr:MAG: DNA cytosine methyltransferase [Nevskiaceae bacterium]
MSADGSMPKQFRLDIAHELIVDLFAGGGGMSTAIEEVFGRHADIAVNHDDDALSMHRVNHPQTRHFIADVYEVDPRAVCRGRPVGLLHLSPDCTHHSQAAGGQPRDRKIRALSWVGKRWAGQVRPRVITLENVKQIRQWGPLVAKRDVATGRVLKLDGTVAAAGERVPVEQQYLVPDKRRAGRTWEQFKAQFRAMGYEVGETLLVAANHGAATTRERLMFTARCDGQPIGKAEIAYAKAPQRGQKRWKAAAAHLDFSLPCPSIFERKRPLADATCRRIAKGIHRYVLGGADPFIVPATHQGSDRLRSVADPAATITAAHRGELMLVTPHLQQFSQGGRNHDAGQPLPTITTAKGGEQMLVTPVLAGVGGRAGDSDPRGGGQPLYTITSKADTAVIAPLLVPFGQNAAGQSPVDPLATVMPGATRHPVVAPLLVQAGHGEGAGTELKRWSHGINDVQGPVGTITASGGGQSLGVAMLVQTGYGEREGQAPRTADIDAPLGTAVGTGKHALVTAFLAQHNHNDAGGCPGHDAREPASTITQSGSQQGLVTANLIQFRQNCDGRDAVEPLRTLSAGGEHHGIVQCTLSREHEEGALRVAAFLIRYYGTGGQWGDLRDPAATITTTDRLAMVTVTIHGTPYVIVDIGLRMLTPRELYGCQGFPPSYIIEHGHDGRRFSKSAQVRMCGNSVSPPMGAAHLRAQFPELARMRAAA